MCSVCLICFIICLVGFLLCICCGLVVLRVFVFIDMGLFCGLYFAWLLCWFVELVDWFTDLVFDFVGWFGWVFVFDFCGFG